MPPKKVPSIMLAGERYEATAIRIKSRDAQGRPKEAEIIHDDEDVNLEGVP